MTNWLNLRNGWWNEIRTRSTSCWYFIYFAKSSTLTPLTKVSAGQQRQEVSSIYCKMIFWTCWQLGTSEWFWNLNLTEHNIDSKTTASFPGPGTGVNAGQWCRTVRMFVSVKSAACWSEHGNDSWHTAAVIWLYTPHSHTSHQAASVLVFKLPWHSSMF